MTITGKGPKIYYLSQLFLFYSKISKIRFLNKNIFHIIGGAHGLNHKDSPRVIGLPSGGPAAGSKEYFCKLLARPAAAVARRPKPAAKRPWPAFRVEAHWQPAVKGLVARASSARQPACPSLAGESPLGHCGSPSRGLGLSESREPPQRPPKTGARPD